MEQADLGAEGDTAVGMSKARSLLRTRTANKHSVFDDATSRAATIQFLSSDRAPAHDQSVHQEDYDRANNCPYEPSSLP